MIFLTGAEKNLVFPNILLDGASKSNLTASKLQQKNPNYSYK